MQLTKDALGLGVALRAKFDRKEDEDGHEDANGKPEEQGGVLAGGAKDLDGANGSPEDSGCEEGVGPRAEEAHGWVFCAHTGNVDLKAIRETMPM